MALKRYEIRSEYGLADRELYKSGSEDEPDSVLEAVAMAGLVGLLRQLGDLSQFAAEIFNELHEEAMTTCARGHGLMGRVKQLEAEFPIIEKAFLTQTHHSSFFSNPGVEWHPNLRTEQNLITRGDLPRFVMDSYEECRGPPRLFLLDKYDVAGAGACLKRYTDPSFFQVEAVSTEMANGDVQKEKKGRKVKKKGSRWKNGGTPDIRPSHAKLHQLLLEERIQNHTSEPARLVKLKRRQHNDLPFDSKTGESYMVKFIENFSPKNGLLSDASVYPLPLKFASENSSDSGHDIVDIGTVSPMEKSSPRKGNTYFSKAMHEVSKPLLNKTNKEIVVDASPYTADGEKNDTPSALCDMMGEEEFAVDGESKTGHSGYDYHSDDAPSETETYMDALATLESEIDTDNEHRHSRGIRFSMAKTRQRDFDANEEQSYVQYSDSQSVGNFSASDDGNGSVKRGGSGISYTDTLTTVAENSSLDTSAAVQLFPSKSGIAETVYMPPNQCTASVEIPGDQSHDIAKNAAQSIDDEVLAFGGFSMFSPDSTCTERDGIANAGESSLDACIPGSNYIQQTTNFELTPGTDDYVADLGTPAIASSIPTQSKGDASSSESTEASAVDELCNGHSTSSSGVLLWRSRNVDTYHENESSNDVVVQGQSASGSSETLVCEESGSLQSTIIGSKEQLVSSLSLETMAVSGIILPTDAALDLESPTPIVETPLTDCSGTQVLLRDLDSAEEVNVREISSLGDGEQTSGHLSNADAVQVDLLHYSLDDKDEVNSTENAVVKDIDVCTSATSKDALFISSDKTHFQDLDTKLEPPSFGDPHCRGLESDDIIFVEDCKESVEQMEGKLEISPSDIQNDPCERPVLDTCHNNCSQSGAQETSGMFLLDDGTTVFPPLQASSIDPELEYAGHEANVENGGDGGSCSTNHLSDLVVSFNKSPKFPANEFKVKQFQADESMPNSSKLSDKEMNSIHCANLGEQNDASVKFSSGIKAQPSLPQFLSEAVVGHIDGISPTHGLFTETTRENHVSHSTELLSHPSVHEIASQSFNQGLAVTKSMTTSPFINLDPSFLHTKAQVNQTSSQSSSDGVHLQPAQSESLLQSIGMETKGNKQTADKLDSIHPNSLLLHAFSNTSPVDIISHGSSEKLLPTSNLEGGGTPQAAHALNFSMPCIVLPLVAPNIDFEDAPPLPPLPPMQWRMGKVQNNPQDSQKESFEQLSDSMTSSTLQHSIGMETQFGASCSMHLLPTTLPLKAAEDVNCQHKSEVFSNNLVQPHGILYENAAIISDRSSPTTEVLHPPNLFLAEQPTSIEKAKDTVIPVSASLLQSGHGSTSSMENLAAPISEAETVQLSIQHLIDQQNLPITSVEGEHAQESMQVSDGEMAQSLDSSSEIAANEVGKRKKIPRPRSPLIEAVAAHDRSTLRKVTERVQPQVAPKEDGINSLLGQIRNKSFNLKPAVVTRPIIHGPKTNLKVAAILEKATQIRKALAGSDEDDDFDSWSDS